jgi:hypothetical protein
VCKKRANYGVVLGGLVSAFIEGNGRPAAAVARANAGAKMFPGETGIFVPAVIEVETSALALQTREVREQTLFRETLCENRIETV